MYTINRGLKPLYNNSIIEIILKNHFNDFLGGIVFLSYVNIMLSFSKYKPVTSLLPVLFYASLCSTAWELVAPKLSPKSTGDWLDVLSYFSGALLYLFAIKFIIKRTERDNKNE